MTVTPSAAEGLFAAVEHLNSTARDRIVRVWLVACSDADAAEWRRLVEAEKKRRQRANAERDIVPLEQGEPTGQNPVVPLEQGNVAGQAENSKEAVSSLDSPSEENPGKKEKPLRGKKKETAPCPPDPRFQPVTDGYCAAYLETFGQPYVHNGGRDGKKLKSLLATANAEKFPAEQIIRVAQAAMKRSLEPFAKATKYATSLFGFCEQFNPIRAELNAERVGLNGVKPREPTQPIVTSDIAEENRRKFEEMHLARHNASRLTEN